ncbi:MAG: hypothetical protein WAL98_18030 [Desulfatiglandaceae bacterium]
MPTTTKKPPIHIMARQCLFNRCGCSLFRSNASPKAASIVRGLFAVFTSLSRNLTSTLTEVSFATCYAKERALLVCKIPVVLHILFQATNLTILHPRARRCLLVPEGHHEEGKVLAFRARRAALSFHFRLLNRACSMPMAREAIENGRYTAIHLSSPVIQNLFNQIQKDKLLGLFSFGIECIGFRRRTDLIQDMSSCGNMHDSIY